MRVGVETAVNCAFELVDPDGEVKVFVVRREETDFDLLAVFDLRTSSVIGIFVAFIFCGRITMTVSSVLCASSDGAAARAARGSCFRVSTRSV